MIIKSTEGPNSFFDMLKTMILNTCNYSNPDSEGYSIYTFDLHCKQAKIRAKTQFMGDSNTDDSSILDNWKVHIDWFEMD